MADKELDQGKRRFLIAATGAAGGVATVAAAVPFVASMLPSERAKAAGAPLKEQAGARQPQSAPVQVPERNQDPDRRRQQGSLTPWPPRKNSRSRSRSPVRSMAC